MSTVTKKVKATTEQLVERYARGRHIHVKPLLQQEQDERAELEMTQKRERDYLEERLVAASRIRQAMMILDTIPGVDLCISHWQMSYVTVRLGFIPHDRVATRKLADTLREIRKALGCSLGKPSMDLDDADDRVVSFTFHPADWPGLTITFYRRMPRGSKCKCRIVTERSVSKRLVCEVTR